MNIKRQGLTALFSALMLFTTAGAAAAEKTVTPGTANANQVASTSTNIAPPMTLVIGKSTILRLPSPAARVSVGNPVVADINLINPREAYLLGKEIGSTNLIIWGRDGTATVIDITVNIDAAALQATMRQLLPAEPGIAVDVAYDSVILKGEVSDALEADRAVSIADAFVRKFNRSLVTDVTMPGSDKGVSVSLSGGRNAGAAVSAAGARIVNMLRIRAPQQVMLEVKIAEINKTLAEKLGFDFARQFTSDGWIKTITGIVGGAPGALGKVKSTPTGLEFDGPGELGPHRLPFETDFTSWLIDAQKTDGLVKILAEPTIVAISGQEGRFLAGGEIMIPVTGREGEVTLESKEFGVGLSFTPTVLETGRINIKVLSAVTDLINLNPATFSARKAATTVQLRDGQSLAIGGLLQDNFNETIKRFPVLGEIPILGTLFRSSDYQKKKTELLIVVTPRLIKPLAPDYILPTDGFVEPSRSELLFGGKMEGRKTRDDQSESTPAANQQPASGGFEMK